MTIDRMIVTVATRLDETAFQQTSATGLSLPAALGEEDRVEVFASNTTGLPQLYNHVIAQAGEPDDILVFIHDDVWVLDYFLKKRLVEALAQFDLVGLAGNRRRLNDQPGWLFIDADLTKDKPQYLSGAVGHGPSYPPKTIVKFGETRQTVRLLDGVLMAARRRTFIDHALAFDEQFDFHFYDMDLSRQAESKGLRSGVWDIAVVHQSVGNYGGAAWGEQYYRYLVKWGH
jgi:GT2 family glycosyltransferase